MPSSAEYLEIVVQLVDEGDAGGQVAAHNLLVRHVVQVLHNPAQRVPVRSNQDALTRPHLGHDHVVPVGQRALCNKEMGYKCTNLDFLLNWSVFFYMNNLTHTQYRYVFFYIVTVSPDGGGFG